MVFFSGHAVAPTHIPFQCVWNGATRAGDSLIGSFAHQVSMVGIRFMCVWRQKEEEKMEDRVCLCVCVSAARMFFPFPWRASDPR